jgi:hypothetical protein
MFTKTGQASRVSIIKEIAIGTTMGAALGFWWQTYHWNEAKKVRPGPHRCCCPIHAPPLLLPVSA